MTASLKACCCKCTACCCYLMGIAMLSVAVHIARTDYSIKPATETLMPQIRKEWSTQPFVDIISFPLNSTIASCPDSHPDEVINDVWLGQHLACDKLSKKQGFDANIKSRSFTFNKDYANKEMASFKFEIGETCKYGKAGPYLWDSSSFSYWLTPASLP